MTFHHLKSVQVGLRVSDFAKGTIGGNGFVLMLAVLGCVVERADVAFRLAAADACSGVGVALISFNCLCLLRVSIELSIFPMYSYAQGNCEKIVITCGLYYLPVGKQRAPKNHLRPDYGRNCVRSSDQPPPKADRKTSWISLSGICGFSVGLIGGVFPENKRREQQAS